MPDQAELRRRIRAAMALADITSWEDLAERTEFSRSTVKDLGTERGRVEEKHLRVIAAACDVPYSWFTVPDLGLAAGNAEEVTVAERVEALERRLATVEVHHVKPLSEGGDNSPENIVALSPNDHRLVHELMERVNELETELATQREAAGLPAPGGELGRRLRERETTGRDRPEPGSVPDRGAQPGSGRS